MNEAYPAQIYRLGWLSVYVRDYGIDYYWRGHYLLTSASSYITIRTGKEDVLTLAFFARHFHLTRGYCDPNKRYGFEVV